VLGRDFFIQRKLTQAAEPSSRLSEALEMSGWMMVALGQGGIAAGGWLLSRHFGWEASVAVVLLFEGAIGVLYGMLQVGGESEPWHGGAIDDGERRI
jgi:hypothetical protein